MADIFEPAEADDQWGLLILVDQIDSYEDERRWKAIEKHGISILDLLGTNYGKNCAQACEFDLVCRTSMDVGHALECDLLGARPLFRRAIILCVAYPFACLEHVFIAHKFASIVN